MENKHWKIGAILFSVMFVLVSGDYQAASGELYSETDSGSDRHTWWFLHPYLEYCPDFNPYKDELSEEDDRILAGIPHIEIDINSVIFDDGETFGEFFNRTGTETVQE